MIQRFYHVKPDENAPPIRAGAELNAEVVIAGLKALTPNPVAKFFSAKAVGVKV